ncbi:MAG TPA: DUF5615 family PIN-like protein, partial [Candidatus Binatia bacterium]|nr:DUF5615 family PIN-like protein [Candidatus Binatia bacterium]
MRVLLDECAPRRLRRELPGHDVRTVNEMVWSGIKNGPLLQRAAQEFDVFLTVDQGFEYQQNPVGFAVAIIVMVARSNDINDLRRLMPCIGVSPHHQLHLPVPEKS